MIVVRELYSNKGSSYHVAEGDSVRIVRTSCVATLPEDSNDKCVSVFYDADQNILYPPSIFILREMQWDADNTRLQAISALKLLMSFSAIVGIPPEKFDLQHARAFLWFTRGTISDGSLYMFELETIRAESTVDAYLKIIRRYMLYKGAKDSPFLQAKGRKTHRLFSSPDSQGQSTIRADAKRPVEAPTHISVPEYKAILDVAGKSHDGLERVVIRLMFEHGLRIGEVLGITLEDIAVRLDGNGLLSYSVKLRNRLSDKIDQKAKTLLKVESTAQYKSPDYTKRHVGFSEVFISQNLYEELSSYIELAHSDYKEDEVEIDCTADLVAEGKKANRYVFLNARGRPLSANLWGKRLRKIFAASGIHVDSRARKTNLSHRFRHGYAMYLIYETKLSAFEVKVLMRHRSLKSIEPYNLPTAEDIRNMQTATMANLEWAIFGRTE